MRSHKPILAMLVMIHCFATQSFTQELLRPATQPTSGQTQRNPVGITLESARRQFDAWKSAIPPRQLIGNIYYVGATGVSSFLITSPQGHILIDTGFEETVPLIQASVTKLGFKVEEIKYILSSHAHVDHTGGHALMKKITGAKVVASQADGQLMETGGDDDYSPFPKVLLKYTPLKPDRVIADGDTVTLGNVKLTACLTPGHTRGATSWLMDVSDNGNTYHVIFFSSASVPDGQLLVGNTVYPDIIAGYRETFAKLKKLPCDVYFGPHGDQFGMLAKFRRQDQNPAVNPFIDPDGWKTLISGAERTFEQRASAQLKAAGTNP